MARNSDVDMFDDFQLSDFSIKKVSRDPAFLKVKQVS